MRNKGKLCSIALASTFLVFVLLILLSNAVSAAQVTKIGNGYDPAIYENKVVWTNGGIIHLYNLTTKTDTTISSSTASNPDIYGNILVWHDDSSGTPRLAVYDISTAAKSYITQNVDSGSKPAIYGSRIVWSADGGVYMRDISTSTQTKVADGVDPDIYDTKIAYSYDGIDAEGIYVYDIITKETILARHREGNLYWPHIYGNKVIWSDFYTRMGFISMYDIDTKETIDVTSDNTGNTLIPDAVDAGDDTGTHADINGNKIVYSKSADDQFGYAGVYVYDIPTGQSTPIYNYPKEVYTTPEVYGNIVVWGFDTSFGPGTNDTGIYVCDLEAKPAKPVADFYSPEVEEAMNGSREYIYENDTVSFFDNSTGTPTSWFWDFGDGNTSTEQNPTHVYGKIGGFIVNLTVSSDAGNDSISKYGYVLIETSYIGITPPHFSADVTSGNAPLTVTFHDTDEDGVSGVGPIWREWNFGDGTVVNYRVDANESATPYATHVYEKPGKYSVTLRTDDRGGISLITKYNYITVTDPDALIADFSSNVSEGYVPLTVQFNDSSQNATSRVWDFNNDGQTDSEEINPLYTYTEPGTYIVNLTVSNENGTVSKTATITATKKSSSSGGSKHSSSGGAGGSPESAKNVKSKELCQVFITSGKNIEFNFAKNATSIVSLNFDSKKTVGKTTTIIEMLKNKSTLTPEAPEGEVYNYLNIWVGNSGYGSDEDNLENAVINFKVEKSWVQDKGIDKSSITLNRYSDKKWNELPTTLSGEDTTYLYFTAQTPGFSPFAITGEAAAKETGTEIQPNTEDSKENTENTAAHVEQQPVNEENTSTPEESASAPGFEMIFGVAGLLAVFLHKRK